MVIKPAFKGTTDFLQRFVFLHNDIVVHDIPSEFKETDVVPVDCGVEARRIFGDAAYTFAFAGISEDVVDLLKLRTRRFTSELKRPHGNRIGDIFCHSGLL